MATATSFASPQMNWDAPDPITAFARFKQKCQLMFSTVLKDADDEEKVSYILLWSGEKRPGYIQQLDIHERGRQEKACHYFRTVRESIRAEDQSSNSQIHATRNATRTRRTSG